MAVCNATPTMHGAAEWGAGARQACVLAFTAEEWGGQQRLRGGMYLAHAEGLLPVSSFTPSSVLSIVM